MVPGTARGERRGVGGQPGPTGLVGAPAGWRQGKALRMGAGIGPAGPREQALGFGLREKVQVSLHSCLPRDSGLASGLLGAQQKGASIEIPCLDTGITGCSPKSSGALGCPSFKVPSSFSD